MLNQDKSIACDICGQAEARIRKVSRTYGKGQDLLVIEDIPVISCPHCGESYLTAETLHQIEKIKRERKQRSIERPVAVASYG